MHHDRPVVEVVEGAVSLTPEVADIYRELGVRNPVAPNMEAAAADRVVRQGARELATLALIAGTIFFAVLFVGFAYEWKTGALDWVRAIRSQHQLKVNGHSRRR